MVRLLQGFVIVLLSFCSLRMASQKQDSLPKNNRRPEDKLRLSLYERFIANRNGLLRTDQNLVANFRIYKWLRADLGIRSGERISPRNTSYSAYKLELQTRYFNGTTRALVRLSNNIIGYLDPKLRRTNQLFALENRVPLGSRLQALVGCGYVFPYTQYHSQSSLPLINSNSLNPYPIFKMTLKYFSAKKDGFIEYTFGSYDVFNAYELNRPFMQVAFEKDLNEKMQLFGYYRYQMDGTLMMYYNNFLSVGLVYHFRD